MRPIKKIFRFLGGIHLAIALIAAASLFVILGTLLESYTGSHLYAAQWTYSHPFFGILLWLFFVNILLSALRRWPFKWRHIPFLITHLGLLMVIGGTILKNWYGLQGNLSLLEGSANQKVILPHTYALHIERRISPDSFQTQANSYSLSNRGHYLLDEDPFLPGVRLKILGIAPHASEKMETWLKGKWAFIRGADPFPVQEWQGSEALKVQAHMRLDHSMKESWGLIAIRTDKVTEAIQQAYVQNFYLKISSKNEHDQQVIPLSDALERPIKFQGGDIKCSLQLSYSVVKGFENPHLVIKWNPLSGQAEETVQIDLQGQQALYNNLKKPEWKSSPDLRFDLIGPPLLLFIEDRQGDGLLCALDPYGRVHQEPFRQGDLRSLIVYDQGFGGYAVQARLPFPAFPAGREEKEKADLHHLMVQLKHALSIDLNLSPPLQLFKHACDQVGADFVEQFVFFLYRWHEHSSILFPLNIPIEPLLADVLQHLDWGLVRKQDWQASQWVCKLFKQLEESLTQGEEIMAVLKQHRWPFLASLVHLQEQEKQDFDLLTTLAQQIFSIIPQLPTLNFMDIHSANEQAHLLSAYLKIHGIEYRLLQNRPGHQVEEDFEYIQNYHLAQIPLEGKTVKENLPAFPLVLETPLTLSHQLQPPSHKLENNRPCLCLEIIRGQTRQTIALAYDATGMGMKWPILNGDYVIRFQPQFVEIPYQLRLRQARQINYPNSVQPYSYEGDILISEQGQESIETTLSMNYVYETWDGYRFYLAGMSASSEGGVKRVQIVVNHDPAKYYLTYPGAFLVALGIILLFWMRPYAN